MATSFRFGPIGNSCKGFFNLYDLPTVFFADLKNKKLETFYIEEILGKTIDVAMSRFLSNDLLYTDLQAILSLNVDAILNLLNRLLRKLRNEQDNLRNKLAQ